MFLNIYVTIILKYINSEKYKIKLYQLNINFICKIFSTYFKFIFKNTSVNWKLKIIILKDF